MLVVRQQPVLKAGLIKGWFYPPDELEKVAKALNSPDQENSHATSIFLDHEDGASTYVGELKTFTYNEDDGIVRADLYILDDEFADKVKKQIELTGECKFGVSAHLLFIPDGNVARDLIVKNFSIVLTPASGEELMIDASSIEEVESEKKESKELESDFIIKNSEKQYVLGVVLKPYEVDSQGDWAEPEEIEKGAHLFLERLIYGKSYPAVNHSEPARNKVVIVENYLAPADFKLNGKVVKKGSWLLGAIIKDRELWEKVKKGELRGWSIKGWAKRINQPLNQEVRDGAETGKH